MTAGGLHKPESAKERQVKGKVLAVGPGKLNDDGNRVETGFSEGDIVLYGQYAGQEVEIDGETCWMMRAEEIFGIYDES